MTRRSLFAALALALGAWIVIAAAVAMGIVMGLAVDRALAAPAVRGEQSQSSGTTQGTWVEPAGMSNSAFPSPSQPLAADVSTAILTGYATWYDVGPGLYAAAGPVLRDALGQAWRGQHVTVSSEDRSVTVRLSDTCACGERGGLPTLLDLSADAFRSLAPLSAGVIRVDIERGAEVTPPPTSTGP